MNIKQKSSSKKKLIIAIVAAVVIAGAVAAYFFYQSGRLANRQPSTAQSSAETINHNPPTQDERAQTEEHKEDIVKQEQKEPTPGNPPTPATIQVTIVRATQSAGQPLNIRTIISGATTGTCNITLSKAGQPTVSKSYPIALDATTASCEGANIPAADFPASGEWQLQIIAQNTNATSTPVTQTVTITK